MGKQQADEIFSKKGSITCSEKMKYSSKILKLNSDLKEYLQKGDFLNNGD